MRLAFVTRKTRIARLERFRPDAYVMLEPVLLSEKVLFPEELPEDIMVVERAPFGILDRRLRGSLEIREMVFEQRPRVVVFHKPKDPGFVRIDGILFVNASLGAVIDGNKVYVPRRRRSRILYTLTPETPRNIPNELMKKPARIRAYERYEDPHMRRIAMFARSYMERRVYVRKPDDVTLIDFIRTLERPVFFDLEFDARALKRSYKTDKPIIRVASIYDKGIRKYFIRTLDEEREFLEELMGYEEIIGYGTDGDVKILKRAAERHGLSVPHVLDLRPLVFPRDPRKQRIALPSGRKTGLKAVAEALGFRRASNKDGYRAYRAYLEAERNGRPRRLVRELIAYNVEDTLMTKFVFDRIRKELDRLRR